MDGDVGGGAQPRFDNLDEDYRTWATYCRAYLRSKGVWTAVVTARPVVAGGTAMVSPPGSDPAAAEAERAAAAIELATREAADKGVTT